MDNFVEVKNRKYLLKDTFYSVEVQFLLIETGIATIGKKIEIILKEVRKQPDFEGLDEGGLVQLLFLHNPFYRDSIKELNTIIYNPKQKVLNSLFPLVYEDCKSIDFYDGSFDLLEDLPVLWDFFLNAISEKMITQPSLSQTSQKPTKVKAGTTPKH